MGYRFRCKAQERDIMKRPQHLFQIEMNSLIGLRLGADESSWVGIEVKELLGTRGTFRYAHSLKQVKTYYRRLIAQIIGCRMCDVCINERDIKEI